MTENIMGRDGSRGSCVKKALNRQIFIVGYLQFVDKKHLLAALCSIGYGASTVASGQRSRLSEYVTATRPKHTSVRSFGSSKGDVSDSVGDEYVEQAVV